VLRLSFKFRRKIKSHIQYCTKLCFRKTKNTCNSDYYCRRRECRGWADLSATGPPGWPLHCGGCCSLEVRHCISLPILGIDALHILTYLRHWCIAYPYLSHALMHCIHYLYYALMHCISLPILCIDTLHILTYLMHWCIVCLYLSHVLMHCISLPVLCIDALPIIR
jgi:uncharacterized membrane protein YhdT